MAEEYTPTEAFVEREYVTGRIRRADVTAPEARAEYERMLAEVRREAVAEALIEFADAQDSWCKEGRDAQLISRVAMRDALRARAAEIREGKNDGES